MQELLFIIDYVLVFLFVGLIVTIVFQILPHAYRLFKQSIGETNSDRYSSYGYFSDGEFWQWMQQKENWAMMYKNARDHKEVYYNNFKFFQIIWKVMVVLLTFRVLVMFFGPY